MLSQPEEEEPSDVPLVTSFEFAPKMQWFRNRLAHLRVPWESGHVEIRVRRDHIVEVRALE